jgi:site-specific recombinase XerD
MYACGLRISEAATLEVGAIDGANRLLRIVGKGDKQRLVPLPAPLLDQLRGLWRAHRHPRWLFPNRDGANPVNQHVLGRTFRAAARAAGIPQPVTAHALRHSYATRLLEHGVDTRIVQILLGHANIATTAVYTHLTEPTSISLRGILDRVMTGL